MDITWYGQSCFKIKGKNATVVIDPFDPDQLGLKLPKDLEANLVLSSHSHFDHNNVSAIKGTSLIITAPGEYESSGVNVVGVSSFHDDSQGSERGKNTIYDVLIDGINIVHLGDLGHALTDEQTNVLNVVDILLIPVGGNFTINAEVAAKVVVALEPKIVVPMHYKLPELNLEIDGVERFLKEMGAENVTVQPKLSISKEKLPEETQVVVLSKS